MNSILNASFWCVDVEANLTPDNTLEVFFYDSYDELDRDRVLDWSRK